jgi:hypothetical protein
MIVMIVRRSFLTSVIDPLVLAAVIIAGVLFLVSIVTGGLLSLEKPAASSVKRVHKIMPFVSALFTLLVMVLLLIDE